jgi:small subunit ribosomal protein S17
MADEEQNVEQQPEADEASVEAEASAETPPEPAPEAEEAHVEAEASAETPPEPSPEPEPAPPAPEPTPAPEPIPEPPEPVAEGEEAPVAAETEEAPVEEQPAAPVAPAKKKRKRIPRAERRKRSKPTPEKPAEHATRPRITKTQHPERPRGRRQERRGVVVSAAMDKTIVVRVETVKSHPRYKKVVRRSERFHAHDEQNQAKAGDVVRIVETRPLSKTKNWRLAEVVEAAR